MDLSGPKTENENRRNRNKYLDFARELRMMVGISIVTGVF